MSIDASIDQVLQDAVDSGAVPSVAAIAADRNGVIYEGAAGPRSAGGGEPVTVDTHFRIMSMTKMVATVAALQQVEKGTLDLDAPIDTLLPRVRRRPGARRLRRRHPAAARARRAGPPSSSSSPTPPGSATGSGTRTSSVGGRHRHPERAVRRERDLHRAAARRPRHRRTSTASTPTGWARSSRRRAASTLDVAIKDGITGPLGMDETAFQIADGWKDGNLTPVQVEGRGRPGSTAAIELNQSPSTARAGTGCTRRRATTSSSSGRCCAAASSTASGSCSRPRSTPRSPTRSATWTSRAAIPTADPARHPRVQRRARLQVGLRAAAQHRGHPGHAPRGQRRVGRAVQHPLLGRPHHRHRGVDLHALPAVRARRRRSRCTTTSSRRSTPLC